MGQEVSSEYPQWRSWGLGPRLASLAEGIEVGSRIVDIGTDHGILPDVLLRSTHVVRALGVDRAPDALEAAEARLGATRVCELCLGDGFEPVTPGAFDCAVMAGFGARKMREALEACPPAELGIYRLVLQPTAGLPGLRVWLEAQGWSLAHETIVREGHRGFITSVVKYTGVNRSLSELRAILGVIPETHPLLASWLKVQHSHLSRRGDKGAELKHQLEVWCAERRLALSS